MKHEEELHVYNHYILFTAGFLLIIVSMVSGMIDAQEVLDTSVTVGNSLPIATNPFLNNGVDISLSANQTTVINATVTVTDNNGCDDISSVLSELYLSVSSGWGDSDDNLTHYSATCVSGGNCSGGADITDDYVCQFAIRHFATPTDASSMNSAETWTMEVRPSDAVGEGTVTTQDREINTLTAFSIPGAIDYGTLALGANTTDTPAETTLSNLGNEQIDIYVDGYGEIDGDALSMNCTVGNITVGALEYNVIGFTYGTGLDLTDDQTELDFNLEQGSDGDDNPLKDINTGFGMPATGVSGVCTGKLRIAAKSDPQAI